MLFQPKYFNQHIGWRQALAGKKNQPTDPQNTVKAARFILFCLIPEMKRRRTNEPEYIINCR
jgi:hypothetical protein